MDAPSLPKTFAPPFIFVTGTVECQSTENQKHFLGAHGSVTSDSGTARLKGTPPIVVVLVLATTYCACFL